MKVNEYVVLSHLFLSGLCVDVNDYIKAGWQPYGNFYKEDDLHYQVMVRIENSNTETEVTRQFIIETIIDELKRNPFKFSRVL